MSEGIKDTQDAALIAPHSSSLNALPEAVRLAFSSPIHQVAEAELTCGLQQFRIMLGRVRQMGQSTFIDAAKE
jgi:hypothetical protein